MRLLYRIVKSVKIYELKEISSNQFCDIKKDIKNFRLLLSSCFIRFVSTLKDRFLLAVPCNNFQQDRFPFFLLRIDSLLILTFFPLSDSAPGNLSTESDS